MGKKDSMSGTFCCVRFDVHKSLNFGCCAPVNTIYIVLCAAVDIAVLCCVHVLRCYAVSMYDIASAVVYYYILMLCCWYADAVVMW